MDDPHVALDDDPERHEKIKRWYTEKIGDKGISPMTTDKRPMQKAIDDVLNWATEKIDEGGSNFPGMTYEDGVYAAIQWMSGFTDERPDAE